MALLHLFGDLIRYFLIESKNQGSVSFSGHIAGFLLGALFWLLLAPKHFDKEKRDLFEDKLDQLLPQNSSTKIQGVSKQIQHGPQKTPPNKSE